MWKFYTIWDWGNSTPWLFAHVHWWFIIITTEEKQDQEWKPADKDCCHCHEQSSKASINRSTQLRVGVVTVSHGRAMLGVGDRCGILLQNFLTKPKVTRLNKYYTDMVLYMYMKYIFIASISDFLLYIKVHALK